MSDEIKELLAEIENLDFSKAELHFEKKSYADTSAVFDFNGTKITFFVAHGFDSWEPLRLRRCFLRRIGARSCDIEVSHTTGVKILNAIKSLEDKKYAEKHLTSGNVNEVVSLLKSLPHVSGKQPKQQSTNTIQS